MEKSLNTDCQQLLYDWKKLKHWLSTIALWLEKVETLIVNNCSITEKIWNTDCQQLPYNGKKFKHWLSTIAL